MDIIAEVLACRDLGVAERRAVRQAYSGLGAMFWFDRGPGPNAIWRGLEGFSQKLFCEGLEAQWFYRQDSGCCCFFA